MRSIAWSSQEAERLEEVDLDCILCRKYYTSMEVMYGLQYASWGKVLFYNLKDMEKRWVINPPLFNYT